jgi:hypothetical protein
MCFGSLALPASSTSCRVKGGEGDVILAGLVGYFHNPTRRCYLVNCSSIEGLFDSDIYKILPSFWSSLGYCLGILLFSSRCSRHWARGPTPAPVLGGMSCCSANKPCTATTGRTHLYLPANLPCFLQRIAEYRDEIRKSQELHPTESLKSRSHNCTPRCCLLHVPQWGASPPLPPAGPDSVVAPSGKSWRPSSLVVDRVVFPQMKEKKATCPTSLSPSISHVSFDV